MKNLRNYLIVFTILIISAVNRSEAACQLCVNLETFNKQSDRYFLKLMNHRIKNIKKDLKLIRDKYSNKSNYQNILKVSLNLNSDNNENFFYKNYVDLYSIPERKAKKASVSILNILENEDNDIIKLWDGGHYKIFVLPIIIYENKEIEYCRVYAEAVLKNYHYSLYENSTCRNKNGNWSKLKRKIIAKNKYKKFR
tara:strand:+ start:3543 stop:4130 length:588 start_codon:yes stop_codon:yes gene_type:complete